MEGRLVFDNTVLSGFATVGWLSGLGIWHPEYELVTPEQLWNEEFRPSHDQERPAWLTVRAVGGRIDAERPGQLSDTDWRCLRLADRLDAVLVTRDAPLKGRASEAGVQTKWQGSLLIETFEACGISTAAYEDGVESYLADAHLSAAVEDAIRAAEK
ncbi:MAG: hypothetical protein J07HB67_02742 [halophilic archaeon J07HB67]|jgi:hypothetical protein|nr:MAG: hypothetical protein J07HB67_02742 [halophilic archaeon J07HB67]